jgi:hypothetical protein
MSSKSKELATFILGAAVGMAIGYFINADKRDEFISTLKTKAGELKDGLQDQFDKGKDLLDGLTSKVSSQASNAANMAENKLHGK